MGILRCWLSSWGYACNRFRDNDVERERSDLEHHCIRKEIVDCDACQENAQVRSNQSTKSNQNTALEGDADDYFGRRYLFQCTACKVCFKITNNLIFLIHKRVSSMPKVVFHFYSNAWTQKENHSQFSGDDKYWVQRHTKIIFPW